MEIIRLYKSNRLTAWFMTILGLSALILGGWGMVLAVKSGFDTRLLEGNWIYAIHILQGVVFINLGYSIFKKGRYFVGWDNREIRYMLPGCKNVEIIKITEVSEIDLKLFEVSLRIGDSVKVMDLKDIEYQPLRRIKSYFEELQSALQNDQTKEPGINR